MKMVLKTKTMMVDVVAAPRSMPPVASSDGITTSRYAAARNDVMPASVSMRTLVLRALNAKRRSSQPLDVFDAARSFDAIEDSLFTIISFGYPGLDALYTAAHCPQAVALHVRSFVPPARADIAASAVFRCARACAQLHASGAIALADTTRPDRRDPPDRVPSRRPVV